MHLIDLGKALPRANPENSVCFVLATVVAKLTIEVRTMSGTVDLRFCGDRREEF